MGRALFVVELGVEFCQAPDTSVAVSLPSRGSETDCAEVDASRSERQKLGMREEFVGTAGRPVRGAG